MLGTRAALPKSMLLVLPAAFAALWVGASATEAAAAPTDDPTDEAPAMSLPDPVA